MTDQPGLARFQVLLEYALQAYEERAGVMLADLEDPLVVQLRNCHSVDDITTLLQGQAQPFDDPRQRDRIFKSIRTTVSVLAPSYSAAYVANDAGLTLLPHSKAIHGTLGILLEAANGVITSHDALADTFESIEHFLNRLRIYTDTPHSMPAVDEIAVKLMVELISTLALVTRKLKKRRSLIRAKNVFGVKDINVARQRLERLLQEGDLRDQALTLVDDDKASTDVSRRVLDQMASVINKLKRDELLRDIQNWLSPPDPWKNFNIACKLRYSNTGAWFVHGYTLSEWKASGPSSLLWINGKSGAGKSVLCSTIIEEIKIMQRSGLALFAFYYYDSRENNKMDLYGLLSSVLFQLCDQSDSYHDILSTFYSRYRTSAKRPSDDDLVRCLINLLKLPGLQPIYLIIDALDECPSAPFLSPREALLSLLEDLVEAQLPDLRICVTSRPEVDIQAILEPLAFRSVTLHEESGQKEDIKKYIESFVDTDRKMKSWNLQQKQLVIDALTEKADGMFRWVHCQLEYLACCLPVRIRDALDGLPATLDETYERTLRKIEDTDWEFARRVFLCLAVAYRPLRIEELADVLAFDFKAGPIPQFRLDWRLKNPIDAVLSRCRTLLSVINTEDSRVVQFTHFSVKEYLTSNRFASKHDTLSHRYHISMKPAHTFITQACLGILLHLDQNITRDGLIQFPLSEYAAKHWFEHTRFEGVSQNTEEGTKQLFDQTKPHLSIWLWIHDPTLPSWLQHKQAEQPIPPRGIPLHYASFCGLHDIAKILSTEHPEDVNSQRFNDASTPLHLTSRVGHVDLVRMLVDRGAEVSAQAQNGRTPLHCASSEGHVDVVRMLVDCDADVSAQDKDRWTPLHCASSEGHVDVVRMLVDRGADVSAQDRGGWTPLHCPSSDGYLDVVQTLVDRGADVLAQDKDGWTPLHWASSRGHVDVVRMLVDRGAHVSAQDKDGRNPLHWALKRGHVNVVRILVDRDVDVSAQAQNGWTLLHCASSDGHLDEARMLVDRGADVSAQDKDGWTPLHCASSDGHLDVAQMLVDRGAGVSAQDKDGWTPLHCASSGDHLDVARMLVGRGADVSAQDRDKWTPLHWASQSCHVHFAQLLVEQGADVTVQDKDGSTPLHWASRNGHIDLARFLVEHGAVVTAQDKDGFTSLRLASQGGHVDLARFLAEQGAGVTAEDEDGSTPLHRASQDGHLERTLALLGEGTSADSQDEDGATPLHLASRFGHFEIVRALLTHGACASPRDESDWIPLHFASEEGRAEIVRLLLDHSEDKDLNVENEDQQTPLFLASRSGKFEVARFLLDRGADYERHDWLKRTPLHGVSRNGHCDVTHLLLENGANVNAKDERLWTPLHMAAKNGKPMVIQLLLDRGAKVGAQNDLHRTPLHMASQEGHLEVVQLLLSFGANVHTLDVDGETALHLAAYYGHLKVAELLLEYDAKIYHLNTKKDTPFDLASKEGHQDVAKLLSVGVRGKLWYAVLTIVLLFLELWNRRRP